LVGPGRAEVSSQEVLVSPESKRIKVFTLISLVYGLVSLFCGIFMVSALGEQAPVGAAEAGGGVVSFVLGIRGSLLANVPNKAGGLMRLSGVLLLVQVALIAAVVVLVGPAAAQAHAPALALMCAGAVVTLVVFCLSRALHRRNLAK
jgi:hypothetical protein